MSMITSLMNFVVCVQDLLERYTQFIQSVLENCEVAFPSSLTVVQTTEIEDPRHLPNIYLRRRLY